MTCCSIDELIYIRQWIVIFRTCSVKIWIINAHSPLPVTLFYQHHICYPCGKFHAFNELGLQQSINLFIDSDAFLIWEDPFLLTKIGCIFGLKWRESRAMISGIPGISFGPQAKMFKYSRIKYIISCFRISGRSFPTLVVLSGQPGITSTSSVSPIGEQVGFWVVSIASRGSMSMTWLMDWSSCLCFQGKTILR